MACRPAGSYSPSASQRSFTRWRGPRPGGTLDVAFYRDDVGIRPVLPEATTPMPGDLTGVTVVLVDDVLFTGRTVRGGLNALGDYGRASAFSWRSWSTGGTGSCRSEPTTWARTSRPGSTRRSTSPNGRRDRGHGAAKQWHPPIGTHDRRSVGTAGGTCCRWRI